MTSRSAPPTSTGRPRRVTEADDHVVCLLTMNHHPLDINDVYAAESQQGRNVVVAPLVYSLALGIPVADVTGKAIANLGTEDPSHPAPVFPRRHVFRRVRGARGEAVDLQARPRRGEGAHPRPQAGRHARAGVQALGPCPPAPKGHMATALNAGRHRGRRGFAWCATAA
jgi:hypothetical protein